MNHGDHGGHGGMPMGPTCSMNMIWNTQIIDTCIVFRSWHIGSNTSFVFSCLAIVALGIFYEYLRTLQKALDNRIALSLSKGKRKGRGVTRSVSGRSSPESGSEESGLISSRTLIQPTLVGVPVPLGSRIIRAALYGSTIFLSFFLMLVFMTYNAYLILAVVLGAAIGHFIFGGVINPDAVLSDVGGKGMACH